MGRGSRRRRGALLRVVAGCALARLFPDLRVAQRAPRQLRLAGNTSGWLVGDGGLSMSGMELATAAGLGLPLPVLVFDDGKLNQIRLSQQAAFGNDFGTTLPGLDFSALAAATGVRFAEVESDPAPALAAALSADGPTLLRVPVGDSPGIRRVRTVARARALIRAGLGERLVSRLRGRR